MKKRSTRTVKLDITDEQMKIMKDFFSVLQKEGMNQQTTEYKELLKHVVQMEQQMVTLAQELKTLREAVPFDKGVAPITKAAYQEATKKIDISGLSNKVGNLSNQLKDIKNMIISMASQALSSFKEKGKEEMNKVLLKRSEKILDKLSQCRENAIDTLQRYKKTEEKINQIGNELKSSHNSLKNAGRLILGKETKEVDNEKIGIAITRTFNMPIKKGINRLEKKLGRMEERMDKLNSLIQSLSHDKEQKTAIPLLEDKTEETGLPLLEDKSSLLNKLEQNKAIILEEKEEKQPEKAAQYEQER